MSSKFKEDEWQAGERQSSKNGPWAFGKKHPIIFTVIIVVVTILCAYFGGGKGVWF